MREFVSLFVNGNHVRVSGEQAFMTLSDFLRREQGLIGTKIVCAEGDCGACSVLVGHLSEDSQSLEYQSIDSCIVFMHQLDRKHVISVEGLGPPSGGALSAVQDAMVRCHGSQCGFCTPGFVVAMHGLCEENFAGATNAASDQLDDETLRLGLSGNLCRCTGYVQIIEAGRSIDASRVQRMNDRYPPLSMIEYFRSIADESIRIDSDGRVLNIPRTLAEATQLRAADPDARIITGATDVGVWYNHGRATADVSIVLNGIDELLTIQNLEDSIVVGAGTTWTRLIDHFANEFPPFVEILQRFGSPQIRNIGTIGGNLANASPISDSIPFLMAIDASLNLVSSRGSRSVPINLFYLAYKEIDLRPDELIESIVCPKLNSNQTLKLYKISRRRDMDISTFTAAFLITIDGGIVSDARVALGGVGPVVLRTVKAEKSMIGQSFSLDIMKSAGEIASQEISAISDVRGSDVYRRQLAENVFTKCFYDCQSAAPNEVTAQ